jgi:hypothetical protein
MAEVDDNCCDDPGNQHGKQPNRSPWVLNEPYNETKYDSRKCAIKDYSPPTLEFLLLLAGPFSQEPSDF